MIQTTMAEPCDKCGKLDANQCLECNPVTTERSSDMGEDQENIWRECMAEAATHPHKEMSLAVALDFADNPRPYHSLQAPADTNGELYRALAVLAAAYRAKN